MKGVHAEVRSKFHRSVENYIKVSRALQGQNDLLHATREEQQDIILRFKGMKDEVKEFQSFKSKEKQRATPSASGDVSPGERDAELELGDEPPKTGFWNTRHLSLEDRRKLHATKDAWKLKKRAEAAGIALNAASGSEPGSSSSAGNLGAAGGSGGSSRSPPEQEDEKMERAIRASVAQTSRGDGAEDARIEAQMRASVREMRRIADENRRQGELRDWKEAPARDETPAASGGDAKGSSASASGAGGALGEDVTDEEFEALVAEAARQSLAAQGVEGGGSAGAGVGESHEDEMLRRALEESKRAEAGGGAHEDDEELRRAMEESERAHRDHLASESTQRSEEEIILEYVKKQSLAEEEFRRRQGKSSGKEAVPPGGGGGGAGDEEDEDLRRALEESLRVSGRQGGPSS